MLTIYLLIGSIIELAIIYNRTEVRKIASLNDMDFNDLIAIIILFGMIALNVILWPLTIIFEIYNIHNGI